MNAAAEEVDCDRGMRRGRSAHQHRFGRVDQRLMRCECRASELPCQRGSGVTANIDDADDIHQLGGLECLCVRLGDPTRANHAKPDRLHRLPPINPFAASAMHSARYRTWRSS